jgi:hypothetical protein
MKRIHTMLSNIDFDILRPMLGGAIIGIMIGIMIGMSIAIQLIL